MFGDEHKAYVTFTPLSFSADSNICNWPRAAAGGTESYLTHIFYEIILRQ